MNTQAPVITLDGPGGAGKGTLAMALAKELEWGFLDSGALYRLIGLSALREGLDPDCAADCERAVEMARESSIRFVPVAGQTQRVELDGNDVTDAIRTDEVSKSASRWASLPAIREVLLARQREFATPPGLIADGRDLGTVIFPEADLKLYITASAEERAQRRFAQLSGQGVAASINQIYREIVERDRRDMSRESAPLKPASDAHIIDTTGDDIATSLQKVCKLVVARGWHVA